MLLTMRLRVQAKVLESSSRHSQVHEHSKTKARRLQNSSPEAPKSRPGGSKIDPRALEDGILNKDTT